MCRSSAIVQPIAPHVHSSLQNDPDLLPFGTATEIAWPDLRKLPVQHHCAIGLWIFSKLEVLSSGHAEVLLQTDPQAKVNKGSAIMLFFQYRHWKNIYKPHKLIATSASDL